MHIILSALGMVVTILFILYRLEAMGIDIGWLNPFAWKRRRDWAKRYHANPIYSLTTPMEVTALLMVALVKSEGEVSSEQKNEILTKFKDVFHLSEKGATDLYSSLGFLLKDDMFAVKNIQKLMEPCGSKFTAEQAASSVELLKYVSNLEGTANSFQRDVIGSVEQYFQSNISSSGEWK